MYLWKCWRESRLFFILSGAFFLFLAWDCFQLHMLANFGRQHHGSVSLGITAFLAVSCVVVWYFGQTGLGRHFHQNAGDFLFTRPRPRRFFVWSEWGYGMLLAAAVIAVTALWFWIGSHIMKVHVGNPSHGGIVTPASQFPVLEGIALIALSVFLLAGILVGLAQFFSSLFRNGGYGLAAGLAALIIYGWGGLWLAHHEDVHLPSMFFVSLHAHQQTLTLAPDFAIQLLLRAALVLVFPLLTQLILERVDI